MEETNKAEPEKHVPALVNSGEHSQMPVCNNTAAEITREVEASQVINLVYSNVEDVRDPATATTQQNLQVHAQGDQTFLTEPGINVLASKESEQNENDLYETIFPSQPSRPAPPKPPPYSSSKKLRDTAGGSGSEKVSEKVRVLQIVALQIYYF